MRYAVYLRHPLQASCGGYGRVERAQKDIYPAIETVGMWEGWEAGMMASHASHTLRDQLSASASGFGIKTRTSVDDVAHCGQAISSVQSYLGELALTLDGKSRIAPTPARN